jgi:hypothetical protein
LNIKNSTPYDVENPGPGLEQTHKCGGVKPVNRLQTLLVIGYPTGNIDHKQTIKT